MHAGWRKPALAVIIGVLLVGITRAQDGVWQGQKDNPMLRASLKDKEKNSQNHVAEVEVETQNIALVNASVSYRSHDFGILEYQVDQGPVLATDDTHVIFRDLAPGKHIITISLASADYKELRAKTQLEVDVP